MTLQLLPHSPHSKQRPLGYTLYTVPLRICQSAAVAGFELELSTAAWTSLNRLASLTESSRHPEVRQQPDMRLYIGICGQLAIIYLQGDSLPQRAVDKLRRNYGT